MTPSARPLRRKTIPFRLAMVVSGALVLLASSCSASAGVNLDSGARREIESKYPPDSYVSVIDTLIYGESSGAYELELAGYQYMTNCLDESGFGWPATKPTAALIAADVKPILNPLSVSEAEASGYGFTETLAPHLTSDPVGAYADRLSPSERTAFFDAVARCRESSYGDIFSDTVAYEESRQLLETARVEFYSKLESAEPVRELDAEWSGCMSEHGYNVDSIEQAMRLAASTQTVANQGTSADQQLEFAVAVADADCRQRLDYESRYMELFRSAEANFVKDHETLILTVRDLRYGDL